MLGNILLQHGTSCNIQFIYQFIYIEKVPYTICRGIRFDLLSSVKNATFLQQVSGRKKTFN